MAFTSCGGSKGADTARGAVEKLSEAFKNGDLDAALAVSCNNGVMLTDEEIKKEKEKADKFKEKFGGYEIEILEEEVREEGKRVHFHTLLKKDGDEDREGMTAYNIDGKWYVDM